MNKIIKNITIGSDPECFLYNKINRKFISSIGIIPGFKGNAEPMGNLGEGFGLQIDNVLAEFNIPPVNDKQSFINNINKGKEYISNFLNNNYPEIIIKCQASARFEEDQLQSIEAKEFGCSVDYNAWNGYPNEKPLGQDTNLRTTGCHIHVGYENSDVDTSIKLVKMMDLTLGVPSVILDVDNERRQLYGKAGAFRITPYGLEYRVLSGYFIDNDTLIGWMYDNTIRAIEMINANVDISKEMCNIIHTINTCDIITAKELCKKYEIIY